MAIGSILASFLVVLLFHRGADQERYSNLVSQARLQKRTRKGDHLAAVLAHGRRVRNLAVRKHILYHKLGAPAAGIQTQHMER